jgi:hypothetical protein
MEAKEGYSDLPDLRHPKTQTDILKRIRAPVEPVGSERIVRAAAP